MTFAPTSGSQILLCVHITLRARGGGADAEIYWSDGTHTSDAPTGSAVDWDGRILDGWSFEVPRQRFRSSTWSSPRLDFSIQLGDYTDSIWDYLDPADYEWDGSEATAYLLDSTTGDATTILVAEVVGGPRTLRVGATLRLELGYRYARSTLPVVIPRDPNPFATEFVSPSRQDSDTVQFSVSSSETRIDANGLLGTGIWMAGRVLYLPATDEMCYIEEVATDGIGDYLTVSRGYAGSTAAAISAGATMEIYHNGCHWGYADEAARSTAIGYVFGRGSSANRGIVLPIHLHAHSDHASDTTDPLEAYISRGILADLHGHYDDIGGAITSRTGVQLASHDDYSDPYVDTLTHRTPHFLLVGSYTVTPTPGVYTAAGGFPSSIWVRVSGIQPDAGSDAIRYPEGVAKYLLENDRWSIGASSPFYTGRITDYDAGGWHDELATAGYGTDVQGIVPAPGSGDRPLIMDVLQDLAHLCVSEWTIRAGTLYPYWLGAMSSVSTADVVITGADIREDYPTYQLDIDADRCNALELTVAQDVLCDADAAQDRAPKAIPMDAYVQHDATVSADGGEVRPVTQEILYFWHRPDRAWTLYGLLLDVGQNATMAVAANDWLTILRQPQHYIEATVGQEYLASVLGGLSVQYDYDPVPSTIGLLRGYTIRREGGAVLIDLVSLHLETWPD